MRFCSFECSSGVHFGFELRPGELVRLPEAARNLKDDETLAGLPRQLLAVPDLRHWLAQGSAAIEAAELIRLNLSDRDPKEVPGWIRTDQVRLLPPIPNPRKIMAIGLNYRDHAEEQGAALPERPLMFAKFPSCLIGPEDPIRLPAVSTQVDPEAELCVVVGSGGKGLSPEEARSAIAGYTVGNDVSARDLQYSDRQWVRAKSCDTFGPCGPFLVTEDEVENPHELKIELKVNGNLRQSSNTSNLIFGCYDLISYLSEAITMEPGDLLFTGTPAGVGVYRKPPIFLKAGDLIEVTIEKIGTLRSPVAED